MKPFAIRAAVIALLGAVALVAVLPVAGARQAGTGYVLHGNDYGRASGLISNFERAYMARDKKTMIMKLMVPTQDANALEKRYQWLRGYGPHDMPGTKHPPILFESSKGSFVPTSYSLVKLTPVDPTHYQATVNELGTYKDEDGRYKVKRVRQFKLVKQGGKWYVADYYNKDNAEDYGFWVDDINDQMTKLGQ